MRHSAGMTMRRSIRRLLNAVRKARAGLTLFGENISPEVPNDLFVGHLSVYVFAQPFALGRRVLDLGSGAGYGSEHLARSGADAVTGVDIDPRNIRYASRRYSGPRVTFIRGDAERLDPTLGPFELVVASNVLEHLRDVGRALDAVRGMLAPGGCVIVAVPAIVDEASQRENDAIPYHRSNLRIEMWLKLLDARFEAVDCYRVDVRPGAHPDFSDPFPSRLSWEDFIYEPVERDAIAACPTISAVFVARSQGLAQTTERVLGMHAR